MIHNIYFIQFYGCCKIYYPIKPCGCNASYCQKRNRKIKRTRNDNNICLQPRHQLSVVWNASAKANTLSIKRIMLNIILPELFPKISTVPMIDLITWIVRTVNYLVSEFGCNSMHTVLGRFCYGYIICRVIHDRRHITASPQFFSNGVWLEKLNVWDSKTLVNMTI